MPGPCAVCNQPASHICSGCKIINYCGKDHQRIHWKNEHRGNCKPLYRIEKNEQYGRYIVAARNIQKGELILQETPIIIGPKAVTFPICLGCHKLCEPGKCHECDGCGYPLCSVQCQVSDYHFEECKLFMENKFRVKMDTNERRKESSYMPIVPLRCLLLQKKNPEKYKKILELQSHLQEKIKTPLFSLYRKNIADFITQRLNLTYNEDDILNISGILDTNGFEVGTKTSRLRGLYYTASMIAHDCVPNTKHTFYEPDFVIAISATTDIAEGEMIAVTYTQTFWNTLARREHLKQVKCFDCTCKRCTDPSELGTYLGAIRCTKCTEECSERGYVISTDPLNKDAGWKCTECGHSIPGKLIRSGNETVKEEISRLDKSNPSDLENFMIKYGVDSAGVLHSRNTHVVQVKHALVQMYGNMPGYLLSELSDELLERKIEYCHDLIDLVDTLDPGYSKIRGQLLKELQAAMVIQTKRQFGEEKITKAAAQEKLSQAMVILMEAIEILKVEPDTLQDLQENLLALSKELEE